MISRSEVLRHLQCCLDVIAHSEPMTDAELVAHRCQCAAEQARAEARRAVEATPDLLGGL